MKQRVLMDDGVALTAEIDGPAGAPVVLFCHSVACSLTLWDAQFAALNDRYRVVRYDARGHGGSDVPEGDYTVDRIGRDALAMLDWVDADRAHLCGLSLGGTTGMELALSAPGRLRSIILCDTAARLGTAEGWQARMDAARAKGMEAMADFSMTRFFSEGFRDRNPDVVARFRAGFAATAAEGYAGCCAVLRDADFRQSLGEIDVPTLVMTGAEDIPTPPADAQALAAGVAGAELHLLSGAGHLSNIEAPGPFTERLMDWLSRT